MFVIKYSVFYDRVQQCVCVAKCLIIMLVLGEKRVAQIVIQYGRVKRQMTDEI